VYCQLEALRHCLPPSVVRILEELPEMLDETYKRVLREINKANREHARHLLQCLTVVLRPLRVGELAEVLAIDFDGPAHGGIPQLNPNWRWADHHQAVLSTCSSLIAIVDDGNSKVVQFSHYSVKEYLTSDQLAHSSQDVSRYHIDLEPAHTIVAQACLSVLLHLDDGINEDNVDEIPLVKYAVQYWVNHAQFEKVASRIQAAMEYFFDADKPHWAAWCRVQMIDEEWLGFGPDSPRYAFLLYYASLGGFYDVAEHLVGKHPEQINAMGGLMGTPLVAALGKKHFEVAELLYQNGADIDVRDGYRDTPLRESCRAGDLDIQVVLWLLNHGADVNAHGHAGQAPIHGAVDSGHTQGFRMLIEHNADIHIRDDDGESPLHRAAKYGDHDRVDMMQVLLDHGANPNTLDNSNSTPFHHLSRWRREVEGVPLLLKHGASIHAENDEGKTPLQLALEDGHDDVAACLKEHGASHREKTTLIARHSLC
jgi:ankyrin repeat protein